MSVCQRFAISVEELKTSVTPFTLEFASERTGVPAEQIEAVAAMIAESERGCVSSCTGPAMAPFSNLSWHMAEAVNVIRGFYRKAGDKLLQQRQHESSDTSGGNGDPTQPNLGM